MALSVGCNLLGVSLLWCGFIHGPQALQGYTCCGMDLPMATDTSRCSSMALSMTRYFSVYLLQWTHPWPQTPCKPMHGSQALRLVFTLKFQLAQYSNREAAAISWPSASPGASPLLLPNCSRAQQSKMMISRTAVKGKSSH